MRRRDGFANVLVAGRVVAIESVDHPSDRELLAFAKKYFKKVDALRGEG